MGLVYRSGCVPALITNAAPLEMLDLLNSVHIAFPSLLFSRDRQNQRTAEPEPASRQPGAHLAVFSNMPRDPIHPAEARCVRGHGEGEYEQLVRRLFDELFPPE